jgi:DNA-binding PadR family transcriptional regulator
MARPRSLLDSVVLGVLTERPGYGYDLGKRIEERIGSGWQFKASTIYPVLSRLEEKDLVRRDPRTVHASRDRVVYRATDEGVVDFERWLRSDVRKEPVREDVLARIAVSRPEHAPLLLEALESYERECLDLIARATADVAHMTPWQRLIAEGVDDSILQHLRAEISWSKSMRRRIDAYGHGIA